MTSKDKTKELLVKISTYSVYACLTLFLLVGFSRCSDGEPSSDNKKTTKVEVIPGTTFEHEGNLNFINTDSITTSIEIEIAETDGAINQGLMHRKSMSFNKGMLFIFPDNTTRSFWMKNTIIPLDIIYVNNDFEIVAIKDHTTPFSEASVSSDGKPAKYVVEVNAGFAGKYGIKEGDKISFERL